MTRFPIRLFAAAALLLAVTPAGAQRLLPGVTLKVDPLLARPYSPQVPFGSTGSRLWATAPQGWGFPNQAQFIYITNLNAYDLRVKVGDQSVWPGAAVSYPSHVHITGDTSGAGIATGSASFTFSTDNVQAPLQKTFDPSNRWTCWSSGHREDWYQASFPTARVIQSLKLDFYNDQPTGGCAPPASYSVETRVGDRWIPVEDARFSPAAPAAGQNQVTFRPVKTDAVRVLFHNRGTNLYTGLYGLVALPAVTPSPSHSGVTVSGDKFITQNDVMVSALTFDNRSSQSHLITIDVDAPWAKHFQGSAAAGSAVLSGIPVDYSLQVSGARLNSTNSGTGQFSVSLPGRQIRHVLVAMGVDTTPALAKQHTAAILAEKDPVKAQETRYQGWFDNNTAGFDCPDRWVRKMYYHRWYLIKKNAMDPRLGHLDHKAFAEGRWTSDWYANVISYGAGHVARETRWLRDPSYSEGLIDTWAENERPDGIYPSHITPKGQQGGQYTDWITSTAWDVYRVHPDRSFIAPIAGDLAKNVEGWKKVYGWNNDYLLVVDSHWWTGMEWQPSFFYFNGYKTAHDTPLRRVDLTSYNYGNADAVSHIYAALGNRTKAQQFRAFANATRAAVLKRMWSPKDHFFYSLNAHTDAPALVKEVVGYYPFAFGLVPAGQGYESAWKHLLSPTEFWTPWPVASTDKQCPAYSQTGWPIGPGGSVCMWNGPTWPHANSMIMRAMGRTLRSGPSPVTRADLYKLFHSFTLAQYKNQNYTYPWTGEYYNGLTGQWKTDQRDYNHSTYNDVLISELIGIEPRADNRLVVDPLLPKGEWSYFALDDQPYHGHNLTILWQDPARPAHYRGKPRGFSVYVDGKLKAHRPALGEISTTLRS